MEVSGLGNRNSGTPGTDKGPVTDTGAVLPTLSQSNFPSFFIFRPVRAAFGTEWDGTPNDLVRQWDGSDIPASNPSAGHHFSATGMGDGLTAYPPLYEVG